MRMRLRFFPPLAAVAVLFLLAACGSNEPAAAPPSEDSIKSAARTPVPQADKVLALEFVRQHRAINQDWDQFHHDFDQWRGGLPECEPSAAQAAFRGFAGDFNDVSEKALGLSRPSGLRSSADKLIQASQDEGAALRRLRDRWRPGDTSLLAAVDQARVDAATIQKNVEDKIADLQEGSDQESVQEAQEFSTAFEQVEADWNKFHDDYRAVRQKQGSTDSKELSEQLEELADKLVDVAALVSKLPSDGATEELAETLKDAVSAEQKGLAELQESVKAAGGAGGSPSAQADSTAFEDFDLLVEQSEEAIAQVKRDLKDMVADGPAKDAAAVQRFSREYAELLAAWNQFHRSYDEWLSTEGGCDRVAALQRLREFGAEFTVLADRSRELPQSSVLLPIGNLMAQAAGREEEALRVLRNNWRPFGADVYSALDQERAKAERLRRQADVGVQELLVRFDLSP